MDNPVDAAGGPAYRPTSAADRQRGAAPARGTGRPGHEPSGHRETEPGVAQRTSPGADLPGRRGSSGEARLNRPREPLPTHVTALPPLDPAFDAALAPVVDALADPRVAEGLAAIRIHVRMLLAWNPAINLTAILEPAAIARLHVADSLAALPVLAGRAHAEVLDVGSGGGFPGIPIAACLRGHGRITLLDSVGKKTRFLAAAAEAAHLSGAVRVVTGRAEAQPRDRYDAVLARAVGPLADLVEVALPLLRPGGLLIAWKRGDLDEELTAAARAAAALGGGSPVDLPVPVAALAAAGLDGHRLIGVARERGVPAGYPRDPAVRKRHPW